MSQKNLIKPTEKKPEEKAKFQRMSRVFCPKCHEFRNTFIVDYVPGWKAIRLCKECAKEEGLKPDLKNSRDCFSCGKKFIPKKINSPVKVCPICYIKNVKGGFS